MRFPVPLWLFYGSIRAQLCGLVLFGKANQLIYVKYFLTRTQKIQILNYRGVHYFAKPRTETIWFLAPFEIEPISLIQLISLLKKLTQVYVKKFRPQEFNKKQ